MLLNERKPVHKVQGKQKHTWPASGPSPTVHAILLGAGSALWVDEAGCNNPRMLLQNRGTDYVWLGCGHMVSNGMSGSGSQLLLMVIAFFCKQEQGLRSKIGLLYSSLTCLLPDSFSTVLGRAWSQKNLYFLHVSYKGLPTGLRPCKEPVEEGRMGQREKAGHSSVSLCFWLSLCLLSGYRPCQRAPLWGLQPSPATLLKF